MILEIVRYPNKILREKCADVVEFNDELKKLAEDMKETMAHTHAGIGLAANQVGHSIRMFLCELGEGPKAAIVTFVNALVEPAEANTQIVRSKEGCLSLPGVVGNLNCRYNSVVVEAFDVSGHPFQMNLSGRDAVVVQHEFDHTIGLTIFDRMPRVSRMLEAKRYEKRRREEKRQTALRTSRR